MHNTTPFCIDGEALMASRCAQSILFMVVYSLLMGQVTWLAL
jgi:hypothetical protein